MKSLIFALALTITSAALAVCEPNKTAGATNDIKSIIAGTKVTGSQAESELNASEKLVHFDQLSRPMTLESTTAETAVQSLELVKDDVYSNARVERYCSRSLGLKNAICVSFCVKWTNYLSRP